MIRSGAIVAGCVFFAAAAQASISPSHQTAAAQFAADAAYCQSWHSQLNAAVADFNSNCSGALDPPAYNRCQARRGQLDSEIARFNNQCGS